jgi:ubiquinone/menaquinone biosynthesis C-methylase UbiE
MRRRKNSYDRNKDSNLSNEIYEENIRVHRLEAPIYEYIHSEIFNLRAQRKLQEDLSIIRKLLPQPNPLALDIGCGTGNITIKLLELDFKVTAIDISSEMLDILSEKVKNIPEVSDNLSIVCLGIDKFLDRSDGTRNDKLPLYDCITMNSVLHHLPNYSNTIIKASRLLSKGGLMYISHEPLQKKKDIKACIHEFLGKIDYIPIRLRMLFHGIAPLDYSFSDYYSQYGFDDIHLSNLLCDQGLEIIFRRRYSPWKTRFIENISQLMYIRPNCFKLLARKIASNL